MADAQELTPILRVACESCKQRKLKCDRTQPTCQRCVKSNATCVYALRRKPGFPRGQKRVLEDRIGQLEAEMRDRRGQLEAETRDRRDADDRLLPTPSTSAPTFECSSSVSPGSLEVPQVSFDHDATHACTASTLPAPEQPEVATYERTHRLIERPPPTDLVCSLISLFYRHIHPWLPFLDPLRVFAEMGTMKEPSVLYLALFNIALPHSLDSRLDRESSDSYWKYAKRRIFIEALEEPSYTALEALTVVTLDLSGMTNGPQVWGSLAVIIKLAAQLKTMEGHLLRTRVSTEAGSLHETINQNQRRRLFWAIYALDSYLTITTGNPSDLTDCHVQQFLNTRQLTWQSSPRQSPSVQELEYTSQQRNIESTHSSDIPLLAFKYQLELLDISRSVHKVYLSYSSLAELEDWTTWTQRLEGVSGELEVWHQNHFSEMQPNMQYPSVLMLYAYYHALNIHLHGLISCPSGFINQSNLNHLQAESQRHCADSIRDMVAIVQRATNELLDRLGWPFAWSVWTAARCLITGQKYGIPYYTPDMELLLNCLRSMGKHWQISTKYWRLLSHALAELSQEASSSTSRPPVSVLPLLTDLRIPTSDLEDRFRVDPVLHSGNKPGERVPPVPQAGRATISCSAPVVEQAEDFAVLSEFEQSQNFSNTWYSLPLYASSAYQQYPIFE